MTRPAFAAAGPLCSSSPITRPHGTCAEGALMATITIPRATEGYAQVVEYSGGTVLSAHFGHELRGLSLCPGRPAISCPSSCRALRRVPRRTIAAVKALSTPMASRPERRAHSRADDARPAHPEPGDVAVPVHHARSPGDGGCPALHFGAEDADLAPKVGCCAARTSLPAVYPSRARTVGGVTSGIMGCC